MELSELKTEHWAVAAVAALGFLAWVAVALTSRIRSKRWRWPAGTRHVVDMEDYRVHVIVGGSVVVSDALIDACWKAVVASSEGWHLSGNGNNGPSKLAVCAVWLAPPEHFLADPYLAGAAGYATYIKNGRGERKIPMAVVRSELKYLEEIHARGGVVIHEMMHILAEQFTDWKGDRAHEDPRIWKDIGGERSAQYIAQFRFARL